MALSLRQKLTMGLLMVYWPGIFVLGHIPIPRLVYKAQVSDKSLHFLAYLILTFLLWYAISPTQKVNWRKYTAWLILIVVVWYGVFDELLQGYVGRSCDGRDLLADFVGTFVGLILFTFFSFWPVLLIVTAIVIFGLTNLARADMAELVPITNAMFHFLSYSFFTWVWIEYVQMFLPVKAFKVKWVITALIVPIGFLLTVKLFSVILERHFGILDVILSVGGVIFAVAASYLTALFRRRSFRTLSFDEA